MRAGVARNTRTEMGCRLDIGRFHRTLVAPHSCELASWRFRWLLRTRLSLVAGQCRIESRDRRGLGQ